jgi:hypothetical protein
MAVAVGKRAARSRARACLKNAVRRSRAAASKRSPASWRTASVASGEMPRGFQVGRTPVSISWSTTAALQRSAAGSQRPRSGRKGSR